MMMALREGCCQPVLYLTLGKQCQERAEHGDGNVEDDGDASVKYVENDNECLKSIIARLPIWKIILALREGCCQPVLFLTLHTWLLFGPV